MARPPAYRKQSTLELPPTDSTGLTLNIQPLQKRLTQQWLDYDAPFSLVREPEGLLQDENATLQDIEDVHQKHWPSRSSSSDSENDVSEGLRRLDLEDREDRYFRTKFPPFLDYGLPPGFASFGPPTDPSRTGSGRPGPSRQSSGRTRGYSGSKAPVKGSAASSGVRGGRVLKQTKPTVTTAVKASRKASVVANPQCLAFGCPMVKGNPAHYRSVHAPCTDLRGIKATSKALMEHLKKHHSRDNRCMTCWKWFKSPTDLNQHQREPAQPWQKCDVCCKRFSTETESEAHADIVCDLDEKTKPELFSPEQQAIFRTMNRQIGSKGTLEEKFQWVFGELHPLHPEKDSIWPWYDFASFTYLLQGTLSATERERISGGLRLPQSESSPSDESASPDFDVPVEPPTLHFVTPASVSYPEMGQQMHQAPAYNTAQQSSSMRRLSAPADMAHPLFPHQPNYAYLHHLTPSSSTPSAPNLTESGSMITSLPPGTPSVFHHNATNLNTMMSGAEPFVNQGMLLEPSLPAPALGYFHPQPPRQPHVLEDTLHPSGTQPAADEFQHLYSADFWDKHASGTVPSNLHGYKQPGVMAGAYAPLPYQQQQHQDDAAVAAGADPSMPQHQWDQPYDQLPFSQG